MSAIASEPQAEKKKGILPRLNSPGYYILLGAVAILVLGPLGGVTAAYMNFSLGFFVGGQVLAGILGSVVTYGYGPEGKHGANYMQTMAASVAGMCGMGVLLQAMVWLGLPEPPAWQLILYFTCIGMFGVGIGMLYTPILVDRLQLQYPSGLAVANILRALTDKRLLKKSIAQLGGGIGGGFVGGFATSKIPVLETIGLSTSTLGAGMVVGARIGIPAIVVGVIGEVLTPTLRRAGWLGEHDPFRKIGFLIALAAIMGAAVVDLAIIFYQAAGRIRASRAEKKDLPPAEDWKRTNVWRLVAWVVFWGAAVVVTGAVVLKLNIFFVLLAVALVFLFVMINGISQGISDSNPISSAFVITVLLMAALGLREPGLGLMAASILLISTSVGCDMQQDRSTGWRLGTNRVHQFRYQVIGIVMGAVMAVVMAKVFMAAYPVLKTDTFSHPEAKVDQWQSAMTFKFVGALRGLKGVAPHQVKGLIIGFSIGLVTEIIRKVLKSNAGYQRFKKSGQTGFTVDFILDAILLPSPYASSFGGFVDFTTSLWFGGGGILSSAIQTLQKKAKPAITPKADTEHEAKVAAGEAKEELPDDMSTTSLVGGGLIAGDSLAALVLGIIGLLSLLK